MRRNDCVPNDEVIFLSFMMQDPAIGDSWASPVLKKDFKRNIDRLIFVAIYNMYSEGNQKINAETIYNYIARTTMGQEVLNDWNGAVYLQQMEMIDLSKYDVKTVYERMKKKSILADLRSKGIDTNDIYDPSITGEKEEEQLERLDKMDFRDITNKYKDKITEVEADYEGLATKTGYQAGEGLEEVLSSFKQNPDIGPPLEGNLFNAITRGARAGKVYINSAGTAQGKSRTAAGNAVKLSVPWYYDTNKNEWIRTGLAEPTLFITTELDHTEVQTMFLSKISGVNEEKIIGNRYASQDEEDRVIQSAKLLSDEKCRLYIEFIPDPSPESVASKIRLYHSKYGIRNVFYDYVHVSPSTYRNKKEMRDDIWLMLFVDTLKQLANELDLFVFTATQLNATSYEDREVKNESLIRGSKAVADKADLAFITSPIIKEQERGLAERLAAELGTCIPNQILDIYKNRRGKYKNVRLWRYTDLGTCRSIDCFVTDLSNNPIDINELDIKLRQTADYGGFGVEEPKEERRYQPSDF